MHWIVVIADRGPLSWIESGEDFQLDTLSANNVSSTTDTPPDSISESSDSCVAMDSEQPIDRSTEEGASRVSPIEDNSCPIIIKDDLANFNVLKNPPDKPGAHRFRPKKRLAFFFGNPSVETTKGIIRLFYEDSQALSKKSKIVCMIAVPTWMVLSELCDYLGASTIGHIDAMRILRDKSPNKYMAVMRFRRQSYADQFYEEYNGKPYSSLSLGDVPERCHLAFVQRVDFIDSKSKQGTEPLQSLFPNFSGSYKEIPTCPVCLERLDSSSSGLLTILCEHTFHCNCLARWKEDNVCPICRYLQQPTNNGSVCSKCGIQDDLWICLLCGHIGCSRYRESHARAHYLQTFHNYALEVETQRVWDYAGDGYVHRLITNKTDGKLVELPSSRSNSDARSSCDPDVKESALEKAEAASIEYQYLLVAQLETQRIYYEEQFEKLKKVGDEQTADLRKHLEKLQEENRRLVQKNKQLESEKLKIIEREQSLAEKVKEQTEYLHDLTMYIEAQKVLRDQGEFVDGQVFVLSNSGSLTSKKSSSSLSTAGQSARRRPKRS